MCKKWTREGYTIEMIDFDFDLKHFLVKQENGMTHTIAPATIEDMEYIIRELDNGEDVDGWEDGKGNTISISGEKEVTEEDIKFVLNELEHLNQELVWKMMNDDRIIYSIRVDYLDVFKEMDLKEYITLVIESETYDKDIK